MLLPVRIKDLEGFYVHGYGSFLLDSIVEAEMGAIGEPLRRELKDPFIFLGPLEEDPNFSTASEEDLKEAGYEDIDDMVQKAEEICKEFSKHIHCTCFGRTQGTIVAFPRGGTFDILVVKDGKITYHEAGMTFVSSGDKNILLGRGREVVVSKKGKMVVVKDGKILVKKGNKGIII